MANTFGALKRIRQTERRTRVNRARKSRVRHQVRLMRRLLEQKDLDGAAAQLPKTFAIVDRAAKWGVIKKNTAARYKSRLTRRFKSLAGAAA